MSNQRYLGLELAGAKNDKTSLAAIDFYPKEKKIFLLDVYDRITGHEDQSADEALLETVREVGENALIMGVNVPLTLPPCFNCTRQKCEPLLHCKDPAIKWVRNFEKKIPSRKKRTEFTPYTQRPVELWIKHVILPELARPHHMDIDEALGGSKAPLTARMNFLKPAFKDLPLVEVWPKLTIAILAPQTGIEQRTLRLYRSMEDGHAARLAILQALCHEHEIFIYERDMQKLAQHLSCFDAFICAYTALLSDLKQSSPVPPGFPVKSGWVTFPKL